MNLNEKIISSCVISAVSLLKGQQKGEQKKKDEKLFFIENLLTTSERDREDPDSEETNKGETIKSNL